MHLLRRREILVQDKRLFDAAFEAVYLIKVSRHFPGYLRQKWVRLVVSWNPYYSGKEACMRS
jgi:hypothetical protein